MWAVLGADQGEKRPWFERESDLGRDLVRKVAPTRAGKGSGTRGTAGDPEGPYHFFLIDR